MNSIWQKDLCPGLNSWLRRHRAMAQTLLIYLLISACWGWMFRSSYNSGGFSDAFRHGLTTEGFIDWLHSLNTWPWVVLFCLFLPIPLVVAHRGQATRVPGFIGMGCLF